MEGGGRAAEGVGPYGDHSEFGMRGENQSPRCGDSKLCSSHASRASICPLLK